jgi:hypothetical protein
MRPVISRHFLPVGAAFDTRQRIFDLMLFTLVEPRFPKPRSSKDFALRLASKRLTFAGGCRATNVSRCYRFSGTTGR